MKTPCPENANGKGRPTTVYRYQYRPVAQGGGKGQYACRAGKAVPGSEPRNKGCGTWAHPEEFPGTLGGAPRYHPRAGGRESPDRGGFSQTEACAQRNLEPR